MPFSPAKTGPLKDLHRIKIMETIAATIKPMPVIKAMQAATGGIRSQGGRIGGSGGGGIFINYNPTINLAGGSNSQISSDFAEQLRKNSDTLMRLIDEKLKRKAAISY